MEIRGGFVNSDKLGWINSKHIWSFRVEETELKFKCVKVYAIFALLENQLQIAIVYFQTKEEAEAALENALNQLDQR